MLVPLALVLDAGSSSKVCDGRGARMVAEAGVGKDSVAERSLNEELASALSEAKMLTLVVVVTRLDVGVLCVMAWT